MTTNTCLSVPSTARMESTLADIEGSACVTLLNEYHQKKGLPLPSYSVTTQQSSKGSSSTVQITINGQSYQKEAKSKAAAKRMVAMEVVGKMVRDGETFFMEKMMTHYTTLIYQLCQALQWPGPVFDVQTLPNLKFQSSVKVNRLVFSTHESYPNKKEAQGSCSRLAFEYFKHNKGVDPEHQNSDVVVSTSYFKEKSALLKMDCVEKEEGEIIDVNSGNGAQPTDFIPIDLVSTTGTLLSSVLQTESFVSVSDTTKQTSFVQLLETLVQEFPEWRVRFNSRKTQDGYLAQVIVGAKDFKTTQERTSLPEACETAARMAYLDLMQELGRVVPEEYQKEIIPDKVDKKEEADQVLLHLAKKIKLDQAEKERDAIVPVRKKSKTQSKSTQPKPSSQLPLPQVPQVSQYMNQMQVAMQYQQMQYQYQMAYMQQAFLQQEQQAKKNATHSTSTKSASDTTTIKNTSDFTFRMPLDNNSAAPTSRPTTVKPILIQNYESYLCSLCQEFKYPPPEYTLQKHPHPLPQQSYYTFKVQVGPHTLSSFRYHDSIQEAKEEVAGDACKYLKQHHIK